MGFISFNLAYYRQELDALEAQPATEVSIYRARRLVKMLDDLADEGYTALGTAMETAYQGPTRLRAYLRRAHAAPFPVADPASAAACPVWTEDTWELGQALDDARRAAAGVPVSGEPFLAELLRFCRWIGCEEDTAYVFLLRDTLLPCVYYQAAYGRERVHPWLLSRRALEGLLGRPGVDDELRAAIFQALEQPGAKDFGRFCAAVLPQMRRTLDRYPPLRDALTALLRAVPERRILVVESGCSGTFPLLLKSLDPRVELRMYTTYPYLTDVYGERIYTDRYEHIRLFETLAAQRAYLRFAAWRDGRFFVRRCADPAMEARALGEIGTMLTGGRTP